MPNGTSTSEYMFGHVPADLFRLFARESRIFFADLLAHLAEDLFGQPAR